MSNITVFQRVVSEEMKLKPITGYSQYFATCDGEIYSYARSDTPRYLTPHKKKTSVGTYLNVFVTPDIGPRVQLGVHQLVCLAFKGPPPNDGKKYEVNHIDGNKHNNAATNLEWTTRSENTLHALRLGLRKDNIPVTITDVLTNEVVTHYSIVEASRQMGIPRNDVKRLMKRHSKEPYQGRWLFEFDTSRLGIISRKHHKPIKAYDYVDGREIHANNATDISYLTGVHATTILVCLKGGFKTHPDGNKLISGYVFREASDERPYPIFTCDEAQESRKNYLNRPVQLGKRPVVMKDYVTGEITRHASIADAIRFTVRPVAEFQSRVTRGDLSITRGYAIKCANDPREFLEFSSDYITASINSSRSDLLIAKITDRRTNTTNLHTGVSEIAFVLGIDSRLVNTLRHENIKPFLFKEYLHVEWILN